MSEKKTHLIIAMDGPSGVGKSTVARAIADKLGGFLVDTGAMYRAVAYLGSRAGCSVEGDFEALADHMTFALSGKKLLVNGEDLEIHLRSEEVGAEASRVSRFQGVRTVLTRKQRELGRSLSERAPVILEGRDIGTVVFPDAPVKFFITGDPAVRAQRRADQLRRQGKPASDINKVLEQIQHRDTQDSTRAIAPLKCAKDAIVIDTTRMTIEEVVNAAMAALVV